MRITRAQAINVGNKIGVDWGDVDVEQLRQGIEVELEHGNGSKPQTNVIGRDLVKSGRIALAHLYEIPDYYTRLEEMERGAGLGADEEEDSAAVWIVLALAAGVGAWIFFGPR